MNKLKVLKSFVTVRWLRRFGDRASLERYQQKMIARQLSFIRKHSAYFGEMDFKKLEDLPYMDKQVMMDNFNRINTVGIDRDQALRLAIDSEKSRDFDEKLNGISVGLSSGTSGHRGLFVISDSEIAEWAGTVMAKVLPRNRITGNRLAFFLRADNNLYEGTKSAALDFRYFDIMRPMRDNVMRLNKFDPTIVVAPPSVLMELSKYVEQGELRISPLRIISVAEVLTEQDERRFCQVFAQERIHQVYQCTEGFLGYTCECGSFHINEDLVYVEKEYIDDRRFVPVITDFVRSSQPVIRYRLNDILVESGRKCACGSPMMVIDRIEGRMDDIFVFCGRDGKPVSVFPDFISRCIVYVPGIREYRVFQKSATEVVVYLDNLDQDIRMQIDAEFARLSEKMEFVKPDISFAEYQIDFTRKMKRVEKGDF